MWKTIDINPKYEVSDTGVVRRKDTGHINGIKIDRYGYATVVLSETRKIKQYVTVHRLVALAFLPNPDNLPQVNHKDENKLNNDVGNLEWCTNQYNTMYGTGKARASAKLRRPAVAYKNGKRIASYPSVKAAAAAHGTTGSQISAAINGKQHTCRGYEWRRE